MMLLPHLLQNRRSLFSVLLKEPILSSPLVTTTACGCQAVQLWTRAEAHARQDSQWQYPIPMESPDTSISTAPQKHFPLCYWSSALLLDVSEFFGVLKSPSRDAFSLTNFVFGVIIRPLFRPGRICHDWCNFIFQQRSLNCRSCFHPTAVGQNIG